MSDPSGNAACFGACVVGGLIGIGIIGAAWTSEEGLQLQEDLKKGLAASGDRIRDLVGTSENSDDAADGDSGSDSSRPGHSGADITIDDKISGQTGPRGWTEDDIRATVDAGPTGTSTDNTKDEATGRRRNDPATVYGGPGDYVVVNDETGVVVQVSDRTKPWDDDDRIQWDAQQDAGDKDKTE